MKAPTYLFAPIAALAVVLSFTDRPRVSNERPEQVPGTEWTSLFNGKDLSGWDTYIGPPLDDSGKMLSKTPVGLNTDPSHVFTVTELNGEKVIRISGENWGAISTQQDFSDYHLQLMFKWGQSKWGQKKKGKRDSGLLYHSVGSYGADYGAWMRSQEFQIEEGNTGDYWGVAGGSQDVPVVKSSEDIYVFDPSGKLITFNEHSASGRHCKKNGDAERPTGQWNTIDLYCHGDTSVHVVNGRVEMILYHSGQLMNGKIEPLVKGKLQVQSEGAEVYYKGIRIAQINHIPASLLTSAARNAVRQKVVPDDYPLTDNMFWRDTAETGHEVKSGPVRSLDMLWFSNDRLKQGLTFEIATDNFRAAWYHYRTNDIPEAFIHRMELNGENGDTVNNALKERYFRGFVRQAKKTKASYFTSKQGFKLGDPKAKALERYGKPVKTSRSGNVEVLDWEFTGDAGNTGTSLKGKPLAMDSFGYQVTMFFRNDSLLAQIIRNAVP